jgi:hypothetical protein
MSGDETALVEREGLSVSQAVDRKGYVPQTLDDMRAVCGWIKKSGLAPKGFNTPEQIFIAAQTALEAGMGIMAGLRVLYVIHNKPAWDGQGALALIRASGTCRLSPRVRFEGTGDALKAVWRFMRNEDSEPTEVEYSVEDAKLANLWGKSGPWTNAPKDMLAWRGVSRMGKMYFSDVLLGLDIAEAVKDYPPEAFHVERGTPAVAAAVEKPGADPLLIDVSASRQEEGEGEEGPPSNRVDVVEPESMNCIEGCLRKSGHQGECFVDPDEVSESAGAAEDSEPAESPPPADEASNTPIPNSSDGQGAGSFVTEGEELISNSRAGALRGMASNRARELGFAEADARHTIIVQIFGEGGANDVTVDRYDAAKEAIKAYQP